MTETPQAAYERGTIAGEINARLAAHDRHFAQINGSVEKVAVELHGLTLAVQRLGDQAVARDATVVSTAAALKEAEDARRDRTEQSWSPWTKAFAVLAAVATAVGLYYLIFVQ